MYGLGSAGPRHPRKRQPNTDGATRGRALPGRRFHALHDKVYRRDVLEHAWELMRANKGAAGIDRQTIAGVEEHGVPKVLDEWPRI